MTNNLYDVINKVEALNEKASQLNKKNEQARVDKEYYKKDLEKAVKTFNDSAKDFDLVGALDINSDTFEADLKQYTQAVYNSIQEQSQRLEQIITAQENGDMATLEKLVGVKLGKANLEEQIVIEEVISEGVEGKSLDVDPEKVLNETTTPVQTQVEQPKEEVKETVSKPEPPSAQANQTVTPKEVPNMSEFFGGGGETEENEEPDGKMADLSEVKGMFSGIVGQPTKTEEPVSQETATETVSEQVVEEPTQEEPDKSDQSAGVVQQGLNFGDFFK